VNKTLILVVDRDNDFGFKGRVETPLVGIKGCTQAVIDLGSVDPEDSDVNALLAAINIYNDLIEEKKNVEIALICGDQKVGHKSDSILVDQMTELMDTVRPDRAILVGDGAEDEYVYPIISSRVPIDSVRRVYVKQAPGVEGTVYIISKMLSDPAKRKRFLAPIGALLCLIAFVYLVQGIYAFYVTGYDSYIFSLTAPIVVLLLGGLVLVYAYNMVDRVIDFFDNWRRNFQKGSLSMTFTILSIGMALIGLVMGAYSVKNILDNNILYLCIVFITNSLWPIIFAIFIYDVGKMIADYIDKEMIGRSIMISTVSIFGLAFIIQGVVDFLRSYLGYGTTDMLFTVVEIIVGVLFALTASILQGSYKKYFDAERGAEADEKA
jgi:putative membrane protein